MVRYWSIMTRPTGSPAVGIPISIAKASESVGADCGGATPADGAGRGGKTPRVRGSWMTMDFFQWTTSSMPGSMSLTVTWELLLVCICCKQLRIVQIECRTTKPAQRSRVATPTIRWPWLHGDGSQQQEGWARRDR